MLGREKTSGVPEPPARPEGMREGAEELPGFVSAATAGRKAGKGGTRRCQTTSSQQWEQASPPTPGQRFTGG